MDSMTAVRTWRTIEQYLSLISDPFLVNAVRHEFEKRALRDWGFCPTGVKDIKEDVPELTKEEQRMVDIINAKIEYNVDIRTNDEKQKLHTATLNNVIDFINKDGNYWQIPADMQCEALKKIYDEAFDIAFDIEKFTKTA